MTDAKQKVFTHGGEKSFNIFLTLINTSITNNVLYLVYHLIIKTFKNEHKSNQTLRKKH